MFTRPRRRCGSAIPGFVHDFVRDAMREVLMERRPVSAVPLRNSPVAEGPQRGAELPYSEFTQRIENVDFTAPLSELPAPGGATLRSCLRFHAASRDWSGSAV